MTEPFLPKTMRAWQYTNTKGGLEKNLTLNTVLPLPTPDPSQHLIQIIAAAINSVDYKPAEHPLISRVAISKPAIPCVDFSGMIVKPATGSPLKAGDLVCGVPSASPFKGSALAEFVNGDPNTVVPIPDGVDMIYAASVSVAGLSAYQPIVPNVKKGDHIFINGGSGGTGTFGIQIAKVMGCHVTTTCSGANVELCKRLGADEVIDYRTQDMVDALKESGHKFDHVVDNVNDDKSLYYRAHEYTKPEAKYIFVGGAPGLKNMRESLKVRFWPGFLGGGKRQSQGFWPSPKKEDLKQIIQWVSEGKIKVIIDQKFAFEQVLQAFEKLKTGRAKGKIVVDVASQTYFQRR